MTTTRTTHCTESDCERRLTSKNRASLITGRDYDDVCTTCYEYWGWENTHSDESHTVDNADLDCPVCLKEFNIGDAIVIVQAKRDAANIRRTNRSHANCTHPRTPKGRAACRAAGN